MKSSAKIRITPLVFIGILALIVGTILGVMLALMEDLPQIRALEGFEPIASTRVYSRGGHLIGEFLLEKRIPVRLKDVPGILKSSLLATEDRQFYKHIGLNVRGILRALYTDIRAGRIVEGGSSLTQQLAKVLFLTPERTLERKLKEMILALQIERRYTKDSILELYLNQVYFGNGAFGIEAASRIYFGKSVSELNLPESALLAGLPASPSMLNPFKHPAKAMARRNAVIRKMERAGFITHETAEEAVNFPLDLNPDVRLTSPAPYFLEHIRPLLVSELGEVLVYKGGLRVLTTLDLELQMAAREAVGSGLEMLRERRLRVGLKGWPQAALVAMDVQTGEVLAMVGGRDYAQSQFNRVTMALRQPGSAFKPIIYLTALRSGLSQSTILWDGPISMTNPDGGLWEPENYDGVYHGYVTMRTALEKSLNTATVRLAKKVGVNNLIRTARKLGISRDIERDLSLALGTSTVTPMELTSIYQVFANLGVRNEPYTLKKVLDPDERDIMRGFQKRDVVIKPEPAYIITDMLKGVIRNGTGRRARGLGHHPAGKTGTSDEFRDAWFVGYTPDIICGVWVGMDDGSPLGEGESGARAALPIWESFMLKALKRYPPREFDMPDGIVMVEVERGSGMRADDLSIDRIYAAYTVDTVPKRSSRDIKRDTPLLLFHGIDNE